MSQVSTDTNKDTVTDTAGSQLLSKTFDIFNFKNKNNAKFPEYPGFAAYDRIYEKLFWRFF